jgi:hypothetical protein
MWIQVFLSVLLGAVAVLVGMQRTTSRLVRAFILAVIIAGTTFVWIPDQTNVIASALGIGRGADLLFYLWVVITLGLVVFLYLKIIRAERKLTLIARAQALAHPLSRAEEEQQQ